MFAIQHYCTPTRSRLHCLFASSNPDENPMPLKIPASLKTISSTALTFVLAIYFLVALNNVFIGKVLHILSTEQGLSIFFLASVPVFFVCFFVFLFTPFVSKPIAKPFFIFLLIASSLVNFGAREFGIIFNQEMMANILKTTPTEATSYFNWRAAAWIFATGILPALYIGFVRITYKPFHQELPRKLLLMAGMVAITLMIAAFQYKVYASIARNHPKLQKDIVPTYFISGTVKYIKNTYFREDIAYRPIGDGAIREPEKAKYLTVVIIGETARMQNYQWHGYKRETNAYTKAIPHMMAFNNTSSCGTATEVSVPCMLSLLGKENYSLDKAESQDNVIDVLKKAGVQSIWIDNNTGCKDTCRHIDHMTLASGYQTFLNERPHCSDEECHDDLILSYIDNIVDTFKGKDGVIYFHLMGSHGPTYYKRYPASFARFKPTCDTSDLQNCTREEIINVYDNTILFTDYVIAEIIKKLQTYPHYKTSLIYMSDHGESLGEKGLYLHGMPYAVAPDTQTHVPFLMWMSDHMRAHKKLDMACMAREGESGGYSHDNLSHTILGLMDIESKTYRPEMDVLHECAHEAHPNAQ
jgi:lipid A ethanolaminephosphotransferase